MMLADIILGGRAWLVLAVPLALAALAVLGWGYARSAAPLGLRAVCLVLKSLAFILLAVCLLEPLYLGTRPRPGSNLFYLLADNSRSLQLHDAGRRESRGSSMQSRLAADAPWQVRLAQDFQVSRYAFDTGMRPVENFADLKFDGEASRLAAVLGNLSERSRGQPVAGVLLFTDGVATDAGELPRFEPGGPPIFPVIIASAAPALDVSLSHVAVSQTNFEAAPVTIGAEIETRGAAGKKLALRVLDEEGKEIARQPLAVATEGEQLSHRFLIRPEKPGITFYSVQVSLVGEEAFRAGVNKSREATLANNRRLAMVNRGGGPYRVLYVSGQPNWDFKFLRRAIQKDDEVNLVGLVRMAKREPKFNFLARQGERTNPLFRGFGKADDETAEAYDEPVLLRLGTQDKDELRGGFPKDIEDLYRYHAVVLDDWEASAFTQDQMSLLQQFVSQRGGGLLMLGGKGSFGEGGYARSPVAEMLPVYLDRLTTAAATPQGQRIKLTKEGWLQPWVRVRATEDDEAKRLAGMPEFKSLNPIGSIKPGASVLAEVESSGGQSHPALVVQPFGRGRTAALLVGDLWRWDLRRAEHSQSDLEQFWRQTIRWLVADVPQPVEVETRRVPGEGLAAVEIVVRARDRKFAMLDNAAARITVKTPDGRELALEAEASRYAAGEYVALFTPRTPGAYRASVQVTAADGSPVGDRHTGWAVEPETDEFQKLSGNRELLERLAAESGGEVLEASRLESFVAGLPNRKIPIVETWTWPLWNQWAVLGLAFGCLLAEWGLRRWKGLA